MSRLDKTFKPNLNEDFRDWDGEPDWDGESDDNDAEMPTKLYVANELTNTVKFLADNMAYVHYFNSGLNNEIPAYETPSTEIILYELDTAKMIALGFEIENKSKYWLIDVPTQYSHNNTLRLINQYMSKITINFAEFGELYDLKSIDDFYQKFGKSTVPIEFINAPTEKYEPIGLSHFNGNQLNFNENKK